MPHCPTRPSALLMELRAVADDDDDDAAIFRGEKSDWHGSPTLDAKLLYGTRCLRQFAFGCSTVVLFTLLGELGLDGGQIGLLLTCIMAGDLVLTLVLTTSADRCGRRRTLIAGSVLALLGALVFASTAQFSLLLVAGTICVISPSGKEVGPFLAVEQAALADLQATSGGVAAIAASFGRCPHPPPPIMPHTHCPHPPPPIMPHTHCPHPPLPIMPHTHCPHPPQPIHASHTLPAPSTTNPCLTHFARTLLLCAVAILMTHHVTAIHTGAGALCVCAAATRWSARSRRRSVLSSPAGRHTQRPPRVSSGS